MHPYRVRRKKPPPQNNINMRTPTPPPSMHCQHASRCIEHTRTYAHSQTHPLTRPPRTALHPIQPTNARLCRRLCVCVCVGGNRNGEYALWACAPVTAVWSRGAHLHTHSHSHTTVDRMCSAVRGVCEYGLQPWTFGIRTMRVEELSTITIQIVIFI